jgi:hypothetical protein
MQKRRDLMVDDSHRRWLIECAEKVHKLVEVLDRLWLVRAARAR